ncbi:MAG: PAS domain-containing protein, partial [Chloroflexi bacterium]|nr:PAS domain-containing protein [Chloroflexota bacterium]
MNALLYIRTTDPDLARRGRVSAIILLSMAIMTGAVAAFNLSEWVLGGGSAAMAQFLGLVGSGLVFGGLYRLNRRGQVRLVGLVLPPLLILAMLVIPEPQYILHGPSALAFAVPVVLASVVAAPWSGFVAAALGVLGMTGLAFVTASAYPRIEVMAALLVVALVAWLAAAGLEKALQDLRTLNQELDQRVRDRTRELAEALSQTEAILRDIADGVVVFGTNGQAILANPAAVGLLQVPAAAIQGGDMRTLIVDRVSSEEQSAFLRLLAGDVASIKVAWGPQTLSISAAPVHLASGEVIGTVAVFRDYTRETELDRMKDHLVSMVSHEMRTPLNAIMGYAEMMLEGVYGPLRPTLSQAGTRIMVNARALLDLVANILDQAQLEAGMLSLQRRDFAPGDLVAEVIDTMTVLAEDKHLILTSHIAPDVPATLVGDPRRLRQILVNLVGNALKFTSAGTVQVQVQ